MASPLKSHLQSLPRVPLQKEIHFEFVKTLACGMSPTGVKLEKIRTCYLAQYNPNTSIGVIFLGMSMPHDGTEHRFVHVHRGPIIF